MRKSVNLFLVFAVLSLIFLMPAAFAATNTTNVSSGTGSVSPTTNPTDKIELGYKCLKDKVKGKCSSLTLEEQSFVLLAMGYDSDVRTDCKNALTASMDDRGCWPKGNCNIKQTAQVMLALNNIKENVDKPKAWLEGKKINENQIDWYLQIDSNSKTVCKITYGQNGTTGQSYTTTLNEDKTFTSSVGQCLSLALNNYQLKINPSCSSYEFSISCDQGFETSTFAKSNGIIYISAEAKQASSGGTTTEEVVSKCFSMSRSCDYEGSLWAAYAMKVLGKDTNEYVPYLNAFEESNTKLMPEAFLYALTEQQVYQNQLIITQKENEYWKADLKNDQFFDTPLAVLMLGTGVPASSNAMNYLLSVQSKDGCWSSAIRNTAFILYSGWRKAVSVSIGPTTPTQLSCDDEGYHCITSAQCSDAGGSVLSKDKYQCSGTLACCDKAAQLKLCSDYSGKVCNVGESCDSESIESKDEESCCLGNCIKISPTTSECENNGGTCYSSCMGDTEATAYSCGSTSKLCCKQKVSGGFSWWWIVLILIILIIAVAIIFREKLKVEYYKIRYKGRAPPGTPGSTTGPGRPMGPPGAMGGRPMMRRPMPMGMMRRPMGPPGRPMQRRPVFGTQRAVQGTLDKLRR